MKKTKIIISIFIIILIVLLPVMTNVSNASQINTDDYKVNEITKDDVGALATTTGDILATIRNIGIIASVIVLSIIGVKYMLGSLQEKADYKQDLFTYVFGCLLLMMATTIPSIIYDMMN